MKENAQNWLWLSMYLFIAGFFTSTTKSGDRFILHDTNARKFLALHLLQLKGQHGTQAAAYNLVIRSWKRKTQLRNTIFMYSMVLMVMTGILQERNDSGLRKSWNM